MKFACTSISRVLFILTLVLVSVSACSSKTALSQSPNSTLVATNPSPQVAGSTPLGSMTVYQGELSTYFNSDLGISFRYPRLYDTVVNDQINDEELNCMPEMKNSSDVGMYITVSDWIEIDIYPIKEESNLTATPYSGADLNNWTELVRAPMKIGGIETVAIKGEDVAVADEEGVPMDYYIYWVTVIDRDGLRYRFRYTNSLFGTPPCMYNYETSDEEIYLKILESFEFIE